MKSKIKLVIVIGESGAGKTTLVNGIISEHPTRTNKVTTSTSRSPRNGEKHKIDYMFTHKENFKQLIKNNELVEYALFKGNYYGSAKDAYSKTKLNFIIVEPSGVDSLIKTGAFEIISIINIKANHKKTDSRVSTDRKKQIQTRRAANDTSEEFEKMPRYILSQLITIENNGEQCETIKSIINHLEPLYQIAHNDELLIKPESEQGDENMKQSVELTL